MTMAIQKTIHNFPAPYPGECLYSLFSRYHARSGNASFQNTAEDLFGHPMYAFHSSITTPYRLEFVGRWYPQDTEIFVKKLLFYHTGFQYYCLICQPERRAEYYDAFCQSTTRNYKPASLISREVSHGFHHLRYCPLCASEEIELYGEPYWTVIAQIDGVDFCPVHGCRLCDSSVSSDAIRRELRPASQILTKRYLTQEHPIYASKELDQECLDFSRDVYWFLNNGASLDYNVINKWLVSASSANNSKNSHIHHNGNLTQAIKTSIIHQASSELLKKTQALYMLKCDRKGYNRISEYSFYTYFLPTKILAIHYLSGNAENFGKAVLKESISDDVV